MLRLPDMSIRSKVLALTVGVASLAVLVAMGVVLLRHRQAVRESHARHVQVLAAAVAEYAVGPLAFDDPEGGRDILEKLTADPDVLGAVLFDSHGRPFARFERRGANAPGPEAPAGTRTTRAVDDRLEVNLPITFGGRSVGTLFLVSSAASREAAFLRDVWLVAWLSIVVIALCAFVSLPLQRFISVPIRNLVGAMERVAGGGALSERVAPANADELGTLSKVFNQMLGQIELRGVERDRSEARLRALLSSLPELVLVVDRQGICVEALTQRDEFLTDPSVRLAGANVATFLPKELAERTLVALAEASLNPVDFVREEETRSGLRSCEITVVPMSVTSDAGASLALVIYRDVSERQALQNRLRHAQKMEAVGQLAGGVAHDFNNILTGILGYAELLQLGSGVASEVAGKEISVACERAADLVARLLAFSRPDPRKLVPLDVNEVITRVVSLLKHAIDRKIEIHEDLTDARCVVDGDAGQLESSLMNLALNARDAMPNGGVIRFATRVVAFDSWSCRREASELEPGAYVHVSVEDTGTGIADDVKDRIFEPFFTTKPVGKGTGLGLAAVYGTVRAHGGAVTVESRLNVGTKMNVFLPRTERTPALPTLDHSPAQGKGHVLLVDDEPQILETTSSMLRSIGYRVTAVEGGVKAVEVFREHHLGIDLVLLDIMMPDLTGPETLAQMRKVRQDVRVLFASGFNAESTGTRPPPPGNQYLQKPFSMKQLTTQVAAALAEPPPQPPF